MSWRCVTAWAVLVAYGGVSFVYFGLRLLIEPGPRYLGHGTDPLNFIWCFGWWPHAILHGQNPFVSKAIWAPGGANLLWTTSVPGLSLLFAPITLLFGPVASYNAAGILLPALAAWTAFLLCRQLTRALWPSLVGGYLFGFSSYVLGQEEGHWHLTAVFLIPLVALVIVRFVQGELSERGLVFRLAPLLGLQFLFSTEITFTLALELLVTLALGLAVFRDCRPRLRRLVAPLAVSALLAAVLTAPFVYYALTGFQSAPHVDAAGFRIDPLNFVVPTKLALASHGWAGAIAARFPGNDSERGAYLGVPALLVCALFLGSRARTASGRFLLGTFLVAVLAALGSKLSLDGKSIVRLPWALVAHLPVFREVLPSRLTAYVALLSAVIVALWTAARTRRLARWLVPGLAVLAVVPNPSAGVWASGYEVPALFADSSLRNCLAPNETVLMLAVNHPNAPMLWQAAEDFRFRMTGGTIEFVPPYPFLTTGILDDVGAGVPVPAEEGRAAVDAYIRETGATALVVDSSDSASWVAALASYPSPMQGGGVLLYRLNGPRPSCSSP
jgi:hypothetical protein